MFYLLPSKLFYFTMFICLFKEKKFILFRKTTFYMRQLLGNIEEIELKLPMCNPTQDNFNPYDSRQVHLRIKNRSFFTSVGKFTLVNIDTK